MKRYTERERRQLLSEYKNWNGSAADFCRKRRVSVGSLSLWRRRYEAVSERPDEDAGGRAWLPVVLESAGRGGGEAECYVLESATGARIKVPGNFDIVDVRRLWELINERGGNQG
jgi:hypothetical protein